MLQCPRLRRWRESMPTVSQRIGEASSIRSFEGRGRYGSVATVAESMLNIEDTSNQYKASIPKLSRQESMNSHALSRSATSNKLQDETPRTVYEREIRASFQIAQSLLLDLDVSALTWLESNAKKRMNKTHFVDLFFKLQVHLSSSLSSEQASGLHEVFECIDSTGNQFITWKALADYLESLRESKVKIWTLKDHRTKLYQHSNYAQDKVVRREVIVDSQVIPEWNCLIARSLFASNLYVYTRDLKQSNVITRHQAEIISFTKINAPTPLLATSSVDGVVAFWKCNAQFKRLPNFELWNSWEFKVPICSLAALESTIFAAEASSGKVSIWSVQRAQHHGLFHGHKQSVMSMTCRNGRELLSASLDKTVKIWDIHTVSCISTLLHANPVVYLSQSKLDPMLVCTAGLTQAALLWDTRIPIKPVRRFESKKAQKLNPTCDDHIIGLGMVYNDYSHDDGEGEVNKDNIGQLAIGLNTGRIHVYDLGTGEMLQSLCAARQGAQMKTNMSVDPIRMNLYISSTRINRLDVVPNMGRSFRRGSSHILLATLVQHSLAILTVCSGGVISVYSALTGKIRRRWLWRLCHSQEQQEVTSACLDDRGSLLLLGTANGYIHNVDLFAPNLGSCTRFSLKVHGDCVSCIKSIAPQLYVTGGWDRTIAIVDGENFSVRCRDQTPCADVCTISTSRPKSMIASGTADGIIAVHKLHDKDQLGAINRLVASDNDPVISLHFIDDTNALLAVLQCGRGLIYDVANSTSKPINTFENRECEHPPFNGGWTKLRFVSDHNLVPINASCIGENGNQFFTVDVSGNLTSWDIDQAVSDEGGARCVPLDPSRVLRVCKDPVILVEQYGKLLFTSSELTVRIWSLKDGTLLGELGDNTVGRDWQVYLEIQDTHLHNRERSDSSTFQNNLNISKASPKTTIFKLTEAAQEDEDESEVATNTCGLLKRWDILKLQLN